ncbi:MAG: methyltransferase domain-containing protein [Planctomycetota bacterium]|nr:methyltransferase domain-containing protein [Planctomycetota bacterium]
MLRFVRHALRDFQRTGAIAPSSTALASKMVAPLADKVGVRSILEVGAGTGAVTRCIVPQLRAGDQLDLCEFNDEFCDVLERDILAEHRRTGSAGTIRLLRGDVRAAPLAGPYDVIVCGLPFTNFPTPLVHEIFDLLMRSLRPGGDLTFFRYLALRRVQAPFVGSTGRRRLRALQAIERELSRHHTLRTDVVLPNIPPAVAVRVTRSLLDSSHGTDQSPLPQTRIGLPLS